MMIERTAMLSKRQIQLQMELIINKKLYDSKKISKDTYLKTEQNLLKDLESEKLKN